MSQTKAQLIDPVDGSLVNADINASAAIAGTKISPDFGSQTIITDGLSLVGLSTQLSSNAAKLQVAHTDGNADIIVHRAGNNANPPSLNFQKTRNASIGNYGTVVQTNDELGSIRWGGADGSAIAFAARIVGVVDGTPGANDMPGRIQFHTSPDGGEDLTERMRIGSNGDITVNFDGAGNQTGQILIADGTASAPGLSFWADGSNDTGIFRSGANTLNFSTSGSESMRIASDGKVLIGVTSSSYKFHVDASNLAAELSVDNDSSNYKVALNTTNSVNADFNVQHKANLTSIGTGVNKPLCFHVNGGTNANSAEKMRLDTSGNLGINTASPVEKLGVSGNIRFVNPTGTTSRINALASGSYNVGNSGGSAVCFQRFSDSGGGSDEIFFETHHQGSFHGESLRIEKTGDIKVKRGDLYFETAGKGIVLGATSNTDANTLEDYEEGTFSGTATAAGYTSGIALQDENYTKIGRTVHFNCRLTVASSLSDGDLTLSGLPFSTAQDSVVDFSWQDAAGFAGGQGKISGTTCVRFGGTFPTHHTGSANIIFSGTYRTAA